MNAEGPASQAVRDARAASGDARAAAGTSGAPAGTSGVGLAWAIGAAVALLVVTVNVFSLRHDAPELAWWEPAVWEYSSVLALMVAFVVPILASRLAPVGRTNWPRFALVHAFGSLAFSALHVGLFIPLRHAAYAAMGGTYRFGLSWSEFLYEYRKDALGYAAAIFILWLIPELIARRRTPAAAPPIASPKAPAPELYDIRDGPRLLRTAPADILAATSAGNYVEFRLADGRTPLARATLAAVERDLAAFGFIRTHRSWLVNPAHVRAVEPAGSGDHVLTLAGGLEVPLSRRFREALLRLRPDQGGVSIASSET